MKTTTLILLSAVLVFCGCSTAKKSTGEQPAVAASAPRWVATAQTIRDEAQGGAIEFKLPKSWTVVSSDTEPLDWDYAADAPGKILSLGVRVQPASGGESIAERHEAYLASVHELHDPKVKMDPLKPVRLADGREVTPYCYFSPYWGYRLAVIIPDGDREALFEFSTTSPQTFEHSRKLMAQIVSTCTAAP